MDISEIKDFPVNSKSLKEVREFSREIISKSPILEESKEELVLAIGEAAQNIVKHAYKDNLDTNDKMQIKISFKNKILEIGFFDKGKPIVEENIKHRSLDDIKPDGLGTYFIQQIMDEVVFKEAPGENAEAFNTSVGELLNKIGAGKVTFENSGGETIGGLVGDEFSKKALWAMLLVMVTIFIYISFRFESIFALGALAALAHDALIALGIFVLLGNQISLPIIGAILTIMGYSLNDTIVVFDRVREKSSQIKNKSIVEIVNMSVNDMLGRTIITSLTTLFVVVILCFGGGVQDFATVLTIGIAIGTFSSIYVAAPIVCNNKMQNQLERITAEREEREIRRANDQTVIQEEL